MVAFLGVSVLDYILDVSSGQASYGVTGQAKN